MRRLSARAALPWCSAMEHCTSCLLHLTRTLNPAVTEGDCEVLYSPEEISGMVLSELRAAAQQHFGPEQEVVDVVITVPAYFNDNQRKARGRLSTTGAAVRDQAVPRNGVISSASTHSW